MGTDNNTPSVEATKQRWRRKGYAEEGKCHHCGKDKPQDETLCLECAMQHNKGDYANYKAGDVVTVLVRPRLMARSDVQAELGMTPDEVRRDRELLRRKNRRVS